MISSCRSVESSAQWFSMVISYLKMKSMALWFLTYPNSHYQEFEHAWPFMLDEMMSNATRVEIERLKTLVEISLN